MNRDELCLLFKATEADFERVRQLGKLVSPRIDEFVERLYAYFKEAFGPDFDIHFPDLGDDRPGTVGYSTCTGSNSSKLAGMKSISRAANGSVRSTRNCR